MRKTKSLRFRGAQPYDAAMFHTTRWSLISAARAGESVAAREALGELYQTYWYPLYAYIRRRGHTPDAAQDLTQEFFTRLLETEALAGVERGRGRFRSFLLAACQHFLANEHDRACALKRGGNRTFLSLDFSEADARYRCEHEATPERLFERRWALALLDAVLRRLSSEYEGEDKAVVFQTLKVYLAGDKAQPYSEAARQLGLTQGAVKVAVHRLRARYAALLRDEIGHTVAGPAEVEDEIRALFAALGP
jgi:RNA polymerase sigma-70 factor (ECF subfamily)